MATKRVVTGEKSVDVTNDKGSIWLSINDIHGDRIAITSAITSCSNETAIAIATMLLNAVQRSLAK